MKYIIVLFLFIISGIAVFAQKDAKNNLADARTAYASNTETHLEETRFALEQFLAEIDKLVAQKILETLPTELADMKAVEGSDEYTGSMAGITGLYVNRTYQSSGENPRSVSFTIMNDSPLMAGLSNFFANPLMAKLSGRKLVKLDGYKGALEHEEGEEGNYNLYIPFGQSLLALDYTGFANETDVISVSKQLPVGPVIKIAE